MPSYSGWISRCVVVVALTFYATSGAFGQVSNPSQAASAEKTRAEISTMLHTFLSPAQNSRAEAYELFWADDLVYTGSTGVVRTKAGILKSMADEAKQVLGKPRVAEAVYSAEDVLVRPYGNDMAALTFRLIAREPDGARLAYRNSGTFLRRNGAWQVISWQATKVPAKEK